MALEGVMRPGHTQIRVLELDKSVAFYRDVLGLEETGRGEDGRVYFKCWDERDHHSLILREADSAGIDAMAFRVRDEPTLDRFAADLRAFGVATEIIPEAANLATGRMVRFQLPMGHQIDLYASKTAIGNGLGN